MSYEAALIEKRLAEIEQERKRLVAICEETTAKLFDSIKAFNESRNIEEKSRLAKVIMREQKRAESWPKRMGEAWERRGKLSDEESELRNRLWWLTKK